MLCIIFLLFLFQVVIKSYFPLVFHGIINMLLQLG